MARAFPPVSSKKNRKTRKHSVYREKKQCPYPGPNQWHPRGPIPDTELVPIAHALHISDSEPGLFNRIAAALAVDPSKKRSVVNAFPISATRKAHLSSTYLRPAQPSSWKEDPDNWLDSNNIRDVMNQYEEAMPDFAFLGPFPIDFAAKDPYVKGGGPPKCLIDEMCSLDLDGKELRGKNHIGIVYNLDPHYKNGSHWVANYINIPNKTCYYFDSYGLPPPKEIHAFMQWLTLQEPGMKLAWNGRRFQKLNSECGMYCLYFLIRMLANDSFLQFCRCAPPDAFMLDLRDWIFST